MDGTLMVKQYIAVVRNGCGQRFMVFATRDPKYYLFSSLVGETTISGSLSFPILKAHLRDDIRRALSHGWGNSL